MAGAGGLSDKEAVDWLRLIRTENVGPVTFRRLFEQFGSASAALDALPHLARNGGKAVTLHPKSEAEGEIEALRALGGRFVALGDADYPPLLAHIHDAPPLIAVRGHAHLLKKKAVGIVGARNASLNGRNFAQRLAHDLGDNGMLVVSGFARGIDAAAHEGALASGTVAVMAGGVDVVYPKENAALYERIVETGALFSEIPLATKPQARHFPRRNRLVSGMCRGIVVVEAGRKSGSLITARMALEQNREVFAVPGGPQDPRAEGTNDLIRQGAELVQSASDVLTSLKNLAPPRLEGGQQIEFKQFFSEPPGETEVEKARKTVVEALGPTPLGVDEIIRGCQLSHAVVALILLELELAGRLERHPGNAVSLVYE